jgi:hypothetical protein
MPSFNQDIDIEIDEFIDECSRYEIKEIIESLEERGFIKPNSSTNNESPEPNTDNWSDMMLKIMNNKHQLSPDDEELIRNIHSKLV